jgi:DNA-directed RNA polymerase sigma subunit (sigma70/sigma32)
MIRVTLEEAAFEIYEQAREEGWELLEQLDGEKADFVRRYFGIFPYQPHTYRQLAKLAEISCSTAYFRIRAILKELKKFNLKTR